MVPVQLVSLHRKFDLIFFADFCIANGDGSRQPTEKELAIARTQGENFAKILNTFHRGQNAPVEEKKQEVVQEKVEEVKKVQEKQVKKVEEKKESSSCFCM